MWKSARMLICPAWSVGEFDTTLADGGFRHPTNV